MGIIGINDLTTSSSVTTRDSLSELNSPLTVPSVVGLERRIVGRCREARTILGNVRKLTSLTAVTTQPIMNEFDWHSLLRQFTMPHDAGIGILCRQFLEEGEHRSLLGFSPGIVSTTFLIETAFVANAEGTTVVMTGMSTTDIFDLYG